MSKIRDHDPDEIPRITGNQVPKLIEGIGRIGNHSLEDWSREILKEISAFGITIDRFMEAGLTIELLCPVRANVLKSLGYISDETIIEIVRTQPISESDVIATPERVVAAASDICEVRNRSFVEVALWETFKRENPKDAARMYQDLVLRNDETAIQRIGYIRSCYENAGFSSSCFDVMPEISKPDEELDRIRNAISRLVGFYVGVGSTSEDIMESRHEILNIFRDSHKSRPEWDGAIDRIYSLLKNGEFAGILDSYDKDYTEEREKIQHEIETAREQYKADQRSMESVVDGINARGERVTGDIRKTAGSELISLLDDDERNDIRILQNPEERLLMFFMDMYEVMQGKRVWRI